MKFKTIVLSLLLVCSSTFGACNDMFLHNKLPTGIVYNSELCYSEYTVLYNYQYKIPMISAEYLTPEEVKESNSITRKDSFHVDNNIPSQFNQKISSYIKTGYDKGHMTPAGDMSNRDAQIESFSMANMTPQAKQLNENAWRKIETEVRNEVLKNGPAYILTGSIVQNDNIMNDGIVIPDYIFKAIYINNTSKVFVAENNNSMKYEILSTNDFKLKYKITLFN